MPESIGGPAAGCNASNPSFPAKPVQRAPRAAESGLMRSMRSTLAVAGLMSLTLLSGCLMPTRGTPVYVDTRSGDYWSGKGLLLEVSEDRSECLIAVRDRALIVRERWVDCIGVHSRRDW